MLSQQQLRVIFWVIYVVIVLLCLRNLILGNVLLTMPVAVFCVLLTLLCFLRSVSNRIHWVAITILLGSLLTLVLILREIIWAELHLDIDGHVGFLIGMTLVAITGLVGHILRSWWRKRRSRRHKRRPKSSAHRSKSSQHLSGSNKHQPRSKRHHSKKRSSQSRSVDSTDSNDTEDQRFDP